MFVRLFFSFVVGQLDVFIVCKLQLKLMYILNKHNSEKKVKR